MLTKSFVALDTETTGIDPLKGNRIIEIGIVRCVNGQAQDETFHKYLNPEGFEVGEGALKIHGITNDFLVDKPLFADVYQEMGEFIGDSPVIIHNAAFDIRFLAHECHRAGYDMNWIENLPVIDTLDYSREHNKGRHNLDALADKYGVDRSDRTLHGAELDARILAEVAQCMIGTPSQLSIFGAEDVFEVRKGADYFNIIGASQAHNRDVTFVPKKLPEIDKESLEAHQALLSRIKEESGELLWERGNTNSPSAPVPRP